MIRTGFLFSQVFWGVVLILFGISAILRSFNINIPFFRILIAFIFIYLGVTLLMGGSVFNVGDESTAVFRNVNISGEHLVNDEYSIIFGSGEIDLRDLKADEFNDLEINVIFGSGTIIIDRDQLIEIKVSSAFGSAQMPDGNSVSFGENVYRTPDLERGDRPNLRLTGSVVFGEMKVLER